VIKRYNKTNLLLKLNEGVIVLLWANPRNELHIARQVRAAAIMLSNWRGRLTQSHPSRRTPRPVNPASQKALLTLLKQQM
jgi:hypothetical protein